jgi:uncharacterized protein (DUF2141 family)
MMLQPRGRNFIAAIGSALALGGGLVAALGAGNATAQAGPPAGCTGRPSQTWLNLTIENVRSGSGLLAITLYADDSRRFLARAGSLYIGRVSARAGTTRACIFVPDTGVYALALYHDENANQSFDRSAVGLPAEGYGFSNNPATLAGLPAFSSVRLNVPRPGLNARIQMRYP